VDYAVTREPSSEITPALALLAHIMLPSIAIDETENLCRKSNRRNIKHMNRLSSSGNWPGRTPILNHGRAFARTFDNANLNPKLNLVDSTI